MLEGIELWILDLLTDPVGFFSVILTGGLVALYGLQYRTQKAQRELMEIEQEPTVLVDGFRGGTEDRGGMESFEIKLSNLGRNPASDLELKVASGFHEDTPFLGGIETKPLEEARFMQGRETRQVANDRKRSRVIFFFCVLLYNGVEVSVAQFVVEWISEEVEVGCFQPSVFG